MNTQTTPESILQALAQIQRLERGSVSVLRQGPNGPYYNHQAYENGRNVSRYVPPEQVAEARRFLLGRFLRDFPWASAADRANYVALLSGVLVDRPHRRVVWRDIAGASSSLSGMFTVFSRGSRQYEAAVDASRLLVESLPDKRAKAKPAETASAAPTAAPAAK